MPYLELAAGLVLLLLGGDFLVRGAVSLAVRMGMSPLLIGLTIVGFGTSTPELVTSVQAARAGAPGIAVGNVVGSNIANILLILGIAAAISPIVVARASFIRDGIALTAATLGMIALSYTGVLTRGAASVLLLALAAYLSWAYMADRKGAVDPAPEDGARVWPRSAPVAVLVTLGGIALTVAGAELLVGASIVVVRAWGVSDSVIGLTLVAVGTSLPELATSVVAALRRQGAIAFGNVVGSNIFNLLGILGITALIHPVTIPADILAIDIWVMLAATGMLVAVAVTGWRITRGEGVALLALYASYMAAVALRGGV